MFTQFARAAKPGLRNFTTAAIRRAEVDAHKKEREEGLKVLKRGAKRDPELYVRYSE